MVDALEGLWWNNDSQIRSFGISEEYLLQDFRGFLAVGGPMS